MNSFTFQLSDYLKPFCFLVVSVWLQTSFASSPTSFQLDCPNDTTIVAPTGECGVYIDFDSLEWSNSTPVLEYVFTPGPGHFFTIGETIVTLAIKDINGNVDACSFTITINEFNNGDLICQDNVVIYLDENCQRALTYDLVLVDSTYGCPLGIHVSLVTQVGGYLGSVVGADHIGKKYTFQARNLDTGKLCWGQLTVSSDSLPPAITCPADTLILCNMPADPAITGEPLFTGCFEENELVVSFTDQNFPSVCDGDNIAFVRQRTWQAVDSFGNVTLCTQLITGRRIELNEVVFPPDFDGIAHPVIPCSASTPLSELTGTSITGIPMVNGYDPAISACNITTNFVDTINNICGGQYQIKRGWTVFDLCKSTFVKHTQIILVEDKAGPVFTIPDTIFVSTNSGCSGETNFPAIEIIQECSGFSVEIITPWGTLNSNGGLLAVPQVPGTFNVTYRVTDDCDNLSQKGVKVLVTPEVIASCPADTAVTCNVYQNQLQAPLAAGNYAVLNPFGFPELYANCNLNLSQNVQIMLDNCFDGKLLRTFTVSAGGQNFFCTQEIKVNHVSDFVVEFPKDTLIFCSIEPFETEEPKVFGENCEHITVSFTDEIFNVIADACYKIVRTWKVVNTCVTGAQQDQEVVEEPESVLGIDLDGDGDMDHRTYRDSWTTTAQPGTAQAAQSTGPDTDPDSDPWDGYIVYQQSIKIIDNEDPIILGCQIPDVCTTSGSCTATLELPTPEVLECDPEVILTAQIRIGGVWQNGFGPFANLAPGTYEVRYFAVDKCGNQDTCLTSVKVKDCEVPVAKCIPSLSLELTTPGFMIQVWAIDFNNGSTDNCTGLLKFSFSSNVNDVSRIFDCDNEGLNTIQLWVTDVAGNQSSCSATLYILPPSNSTCDDGSISGHILTEDNKGVAQVQIGNFAQTDLDGQYTIPPGGTIIIAPYKNINIANGVTTFDAVLLTKHVLGTQPLGSPYKIIAADVNKSNSVTTFDAVEMRKIILGIYSDAIPNNTSWRFIPAGFVFPNPANPFASAFPESVTINTYPPPPGSLDFVGLKVGDLNNSVDPANFSPEVEDRNFTGTLPFLLRDVWVKKGERITIPFCLPPIAVHGYQFALNCDRKKATFLDVLPGFAGIENFAFKQMEENLLKTSWHSGTPFTPKEDEPAFTLVLEARTDGFLSDWLRIEPAALASEAYDAKLGLLQPEIIFMQENTFRLLDIRPNPFRANTSIGFYMPEAGTATLTVFNATGSMVTKQSGFFEKGIQVMEISGGALPEGRLYFFRIQTEFGQGEGKLMKM